MKKLLVWMTVGASIITMSHLFTPGPRHHAVTRYRDDRAASSQRMTITPAGTVIPAGTSLQCTVLGHSRNGTTGTVTAEMKWASSHASCAVVTPEGLATGLQDGETPISATRAEGSCSTELRKDSWVIFTTSGSVFAPVLVVRPGASVEWRFADGTQSNSPCPRKTFPGAAIRQNRLRVTPWNALTGVNLGFDGSDGGSRTIEHVSPQGVIQVENMVLMAPSLRRWCSSYNQIPSLCFDNFINLDTIECYRSTALTSISLRNTPSLRRACLEHCRLASLDMSGSPNIEDLRSALNRNSGISFGSGGKRLWHLCVRDNPQFAMNLPIDHFRNMRELLIWNDNQSGPLNNTSHCLTYVDISANRYTSADFTHNPNLITCLCSNNKLASLELGQCPRLTTLNCSHNNLTGLDISSCAALTSIDAHHNLLTQAEVDEILDTLVKGNHTGGTCILTLNSPPSRAGLISCDILIGRGWSVAVSNRLSDVIWTMQHVLGRVYHIVHALLENTTCVMNSA